MKCKFCNSESPLDKKWFAFFKSEWIRISSLKPLIPWVSPTALPRILDSIPLMCPSCHNIKDVE